MGTSFRACTIAASKKTVSISVMLLSTFSGAYSQSQQLQDPSHPLHNRDLISYERRELPKSTYAVEIPECVITISPMQESYALSDAQQIRDVAQTLIQARLQDTSWPTDTKYESAWLSGIDTFLLMNGKGYVTVEGGIVMFEAQSADEAPNWNVVRSIIDDEITKSLAQALVDSGEYPNVKEAGVRYNTDAPIPTPAPTTVPTTLSTASPTTAPTALPTLTPTITATEILTTTPTPTPSSVTISTPATFPPTIEVTALTGTPTSTPTLEVGAIEASPPNASAIEQQVKPREASGSSAGVPVVVSSVTVAVALAMLAIMFIVWRRRRTEKSFEETGSHNDASPAIGKGSNVEASSDAGSSSRFGRIVAALDAVVLPRGVAAHSDLDYSETSSDTEDFPPDFDNVEEVRPTIVPVGDMKRYQIQHRNPILEEEMEGFEGWGDDSQSRSVPGDASREIV